MGLRDLENHWPNVLIFIVCWAWASMMFIAPLSQPADTVDLGDKGIVFPQPDNEKKYEHIDSYLVRRVYESGDRNCHQHGSRSIYLNGNQMPYCSRCVAIFVGMAVGALISLLVFVRLDWKWVVAGLVPMAIDGGIQLVTAYESNNILRILTGMPAGLITTLALGGVLYEVGEMFARIQDEKVRSNKVLGKKGPRIPFRARPYIFSGLILLMLTGMITTDYVLHDGYNEEEPDLKLYIYDADFTAVNTSLHPGDEVMEITHVEGGNLDWAMLSIQIGLDSTTYHCSVMSVENKPYDRYTNHITQTGDVVNVTLLDDELPAGSVVSVTIKDGPEVIWRTDNNITIK